MFGYVWANDVIKKYVIYFGTLFSNVYLIRGEEGNPAQTMKVPLGYGNREKFMARADGNPDLERPIAIQLPRMSFEVTDYQYDPERKLSTMGKICAGPSESGKKSFQYNPVPYNLTFSLYIMVKNHIDGTRIVEQILPFFTPSFTGTLVINEASGQKFDVPLTLNSVQHTDTYEGSFEERRTQIWTLTFTLKAWLFGPTLSSDVIKQIEVNFMVPQPGVTIDQAIGNTPPSIEVVITPGLTADGQPTSDPDLTIPKEEINADDPYGFITQFTESI